jgi:hypothetical protein
VSMELAVALRTITARPCPATSPHGDDERDLRRGVEIHDALPLVRKVDHPD